ncbi:MAG TPA: hypothetical protein VFK92_00905 [Burkholderiales bacterium]|nr:hypothetical protein [Burkholderiales bacterium]
MRRSEFPRASVLPHIEYARRAPLRAAGLFTAVGLASVFGYALGLAAAIGLGAVISATLERRNPPPVRPAHTGFNPAPFMLNAFLVPALDPDEVPLRWVDPRPALGCEPRTAVLVNGVRLKPGALVPAAPFDVEWLAQGCRPFGAGGPRFDGGLTLTVFREDWGFSALVRPFNLRAVQDGNPITIRRGVATYPQCIDGDGHASCL